VSAGVHPELRDSRKSFTTGNGWFTFALKKEPHMERVIVINSDQMGQRDEKLGRRLVANFLKTLLAAEKKPKMLVLYNSGVKLAAKDSPVLETLQSLENLGMEIICCGTCVNFYGLTDLIQAGRVTNMPEIVKVLTESESVVTL
jgi:selenium metabolism protein YedF